MKCVQNVGKPKVKFRFDIGPYLGGTVTKVPTHFSISTTGRGDRIRWNAYPSGAVAIQRRVGGSWLEEVPVAQFFEDTDNITDDEMALFDMVMHGALQEITQLLPGLQGVDEALKERFNL